MSPDEGLRELRTGLHAMREALEALKDSALGLEEFVEGCKAGPGPCGGTSSSWNLCAYSSLQDNGSHPVGAGVQLSNGHSSPACRDPVSGAPVACPCCAACHRLACMVDAALAEMPSDGAVDALNVTYSPEEILDAARETVDQYRPSIESTMESLAPVNDSMVQAEGEVNAHMYKLVAADGVLWLPAACVLTCVGMALLRTMARSPGDLDDTDETDEGQGTPMRDEGKHAEEARKGAALWYLHMSFYGGLAAAALLAAPMFALLSIGTLPLSDVCLIIPATNESASALLRVLEVEGAVTASSAARTFALSASSLAPHPRSTARAWPRASALFAQLQHVSEHMRQRVRPAAASAAVAAATAPAAGGGSRGAASRARARGGGGAKVDMEAVLRGDAAHGWLGRVERRLLGVSAGAMGISGGLGEAGWGSVFLPADGGDAGENSTDDGDNDDGASLPRRLVEDCVCRPEGSAWGVLGVSDDKMKTHLRMRNASEALPAQSRSTALSMLRYEAISEIYQESSVLFASSDKADAALGVSGCDAADPLAFPTCAVDMDLYSQDLAPRQRQLKDAGENLQVALGNLQDTTLAVQQNVTKLMALSDYYTGAMYKVVWEVIFFLTFKEYSVY